MNQPGATLPAQGIVSWLESLATKDRVIERRHPCSQGDSMARYSMIIIDGILSRALKYRNGTRQVVSVHVPGDFIHLGRDLFDEAETFAMTRSVVALVPNSCLNQIAKDQPDKLRDLWNWAGTEAAVCRSGVFRLGRLDALGRIAHFLSEMNFRFAASGLSDGYRFPLALTQPDLAEICGLTPVHVNRVMRKLREMQLCTFRSSLVEISDRVRFEAIGQFDCRYLQVLTHREKPMIPVRR